MVPNILEGKIGNTEKKHRKKHRKRAHKKGMKKWKN
jgi:hypothetical protein